MKQSNYIKIQPFDCARGRQSGAALVITLVVITVVSAIAFSISRSAISEVKQITRLEDSEMAYQAAESGIEAGLLLYRYNKNIETPADIIGGMDEKQDNIMRVNVTDGKLVTANLEKPSSNTSLSALVKNKQYYDLRIWHKNAAGEGEKVEYSICNEPEIGQEYPAYCVDGSFPGEKIIPTIPKDGTVEYDVSNYNGRIRANWNYTKVPSSAEISSYVFEITPIKNDGTVDYDNKIINQFSATTNESIDVNGISIIRMQSHGGSIKDYSLEPESSAADSKLDSRYTYIESTGYFGTSKRKIKVKIDRQSGSIYGIYDFVIFTESDVKPNE